MDATLFTRDNRRIGWIAIAALAGVLVGLIAGPVLAGAATPAPRYPSVVSASDQPPEHTISVMGSGKVTVVPDMATIRLGVVVERDTAKKARAVAAESMTRIIAAIRKLGIEERDIATSSVSLQPVYNYPQNQAPKIRGYQLQNVVTVTVRDLDKLGDVLDDSVVAGATSIDGITFDVADRTAAEKSAREAAVADAKAKADTLAAGVGVRITGLASMSETVSTPVWYDKTFAGAAIAEDTAATPVMAGSTDVTISVSVSFLIG